MNVTYYVSDVSDVPYVYPNLKSKFLFVLFCLSAISDVSMENQDDDDTEYAYGIR